jgi:branched-chain amino acid aminotransferase
VKLVTEGEDGGGNVPVEGPPRVAPDRAPNGPPHDGRPVVRVNGAAADPAAFLLSPFDRGFTLADGLFETVRCYGGVPFRLERHLERLRAGALALDLPVPTALERTLAQTLDEARAAGLLDAVLRVTLSRGAGAPGVAPPLDAEPTTVVAVHPLPRFAPTLYTAGLTAHVATGRRNERAQTAGLKTLAYTDAVAALAEARRAGADEAIFLDTAEHLSEATASNVFLMRDGTLVTPPLSCGALAGVTRATVLELVAGTVLPLEEGTATLGDLHQASEAFVTSSVRELVPLVRVAGRPVGDGTPGPVTRRLMAAYGELVFRECYGAAGGPARS